MDPITPLVLIAGIAGAVWLGFRTLHPRHVRRESWRIICYRCERAGKGIEPDCDECRSVQMMPLSAYQAAGGGTGFYPNRLGPFVSSLCVGQWKPNYDYTNLPRGRRHMPIFDFDFPVTWTPSGQGGRLVLLRRMPLSKYLGILETLEGLQLIAPGTTSLSSVAYGEQALIVGILGYRAPGSDALSEAVIQLTVPARLVPSSTEGHFHLYLDTVLDWSDYLRLMRAMVEAGLLEKEWVDMNERRKMAMLRKPEYKKAPT